MKYLEPASALMALKWMTAIDQYLGPVRRGGRWRIRWIRIDPLAASEGLLVAAFEEDLACDPDALDFADRPELDPAMPLPPALTVRHETDAPPGMSGGSVEGAALLRAERDLGAQSDRWVNSAVEGWRDLCLLRGHE